MNKKEFSQLCIGLKAAYPRFQMLTTDAEMSFWYTMLQDIDYEVAQNAVLEYISTNTFPPSIADIRKLCVDRMHAPVLSFNEAWGVVQSAITNYGFYNPQEAFATMDELTLSVVKNLGWSYLCHSENPAADRANFREAYEAKAKEVKNNMRLPEFVEKNKRQIQEHYMPAIEEKRAPQIEEQRPADIRDTLTEEQLAQRAQWLAETRKRILGGREQEG